MGELETAETRSVAWRERWPKLAPMRGRLLVSGVNSSGQFLRQGWYEVTPGFDDDAGCYGGSCDVSGAELPIGFDARGSSW